MNNVKYSGTTVHCQLDSESDRKGYLASSITAMPNRRIERGTKLAGIKLYEHGGSTLGYHSWHTWILSKDILLHPEALVWNWRCCVCTKQHLQSPLSSWLWWPPISASSYWAKSRLFPRPIARSGQDQPLHFSSLFNNPLDFEMHWCLMQEALEDHNWEGWAWQGWICPSHVTVSSRVPRLLRQDIQGQKNTGQRFWEVKERSKGCEEGGIQAW